MKLLVCNLSFSDITSPGWPYDSGPGRRCQWKFVTKPGAHIMINFKKMDMLKPIDRICNRQVVAVGDMDTAFHSITENDKWHPFCGDLVPNYPGPSTFTSGMCEVCEKCVGSNEIVSGGNSMHMLYVTDSSEQTIQRGKGFQV